MSRNTTLSRHEQEQIFERLRAMSRYYNYSSLFVEANEKIKGLDVVWLHTNFFRFMLEFESLERREIMVYLYHFSTFEDLIGKMYDSLHDDLLYGRSKLQSKYNVARPASPAWHTNLEKHCSELYFLIKSVFYFRYSASLIRLQSPTYKKYLRDVMDSLDFATVYQGVEELPQSAEKDRLLKLLVDPIAGFRVKHGRRDVSLKEYYGV